MGNTCQVCNHPQKLEMEREYVQGVSQTEIAKKYGCSGQSVHNHMHNHLSRQLVQAWERKFGFEYEGILESIEELITRTKHILRQAERDKKNTLALKAIKEARSGYELLQRIAFNLHEARCRELETEHLRQDFESSQKLITDEQQFSVLTDEELKFLIRVSKKLKTGNEKYSALPKRLKTAELTTPELDMSTNNPEFEDIEAEIDNEAEINADKSIEVKPIYDAHPDLPDEKYFNGNKVVIKRK